MSRIYRCYRCREMKADTEFSGGASSRRLGRDGWCRVCRRDYTREYRARKFANYLDIGGGRGRGFRWTEQEHQVLRDNYGLMTLAQLRALLPGRTERSIHAKAERLGLNYWQVYYESMDINAMIDAAQAEARHGVAQRAA